MTAPNEVVLQAATLSDAAVLSNLLELYSHDLSDVFALEPGADGRFGYRNLSLYWSECARRSAFLIRVGTRLGGFALVTRGSPGSDDPNDLDIAEFFILRRHRRSGVGRRAACLLWDRFPNRWIVRVSEGNQNGIRFWSSVIAEYTRGIFLETTRPGSPHPWRVFSFNSVKQQTAGVT